MPVSPADGEDLARAVAVIYEDAEHALLAIVARALAEGIDSPSWARAKLAAIGDVRQALEEVTQALQQDASGAIGRAIVEAYRRGDQSAVAELGALAEGRRHFVATHLPNARAVDRLAAAAVAEQGPVWQRVLRAPLGENVFSYDDTRLFTSFVAEYLVSRSPDSFTIERMKKKRGNRLYVDYVQHGEGKTIVAPYSMRGNEHAGVATPLFWEEVNEKLEVEAFTLQTALKRIRHQRDPFRNYFETKKMQPFSPVLEFLKNGNRKKG